MDILHSDDTRDVVKVQVEKILEDESVKNALENLLSDVTATPKVRQIDNNHYEMFWLLHNFRFNFYSSRYGKHYQTSSGRCLLPKLSQSREANLAKK